MYHVQLILLLHVSPSSKASLPQFGSTADLAAHFQVWFISATVKCREWWTNKGIMFRHWGGTNIACAVFPQIWNLQFSMRCQEGKNMQKNERTKAHKSDRSIPNVFCCFCRNTFHKNSPLPFPSCQSRTWPLFWQVQNDSVPPLT